MSAPAWSKRPLSTAGLNGLRHLAGDKAAPFPKARQAKEQLVRGLIARGLIEPDGWQITPAGRAALQKAGAQ